MILYSSSYLIDKLSSKGEFLDKYISIYYSPNFSIAYSSVKPTNPYSLGVNTADGTDSSKYIVFPLIFFSFKANLLANNIPLFYAAGVNSGTPSKTSPIA